MIPIAALVGFLALSRTGLESRKLYYDDGSLFLEETRRGTQIVGEARYYYESGALMATYRYKDGMVSGNAKTFHENGSLAVCTRYEEGKKHGKQVVHGENGAVVALLSYRFGQLHGPFSFFDTDGHTVFGGEFRNNRPQSGLFPSLVEDRVEWAVAQDDLYVLSYDDGELVGSVEKKTHFPKIWLGITP